MKTIRTFLAIPLPASLAQGASEWILEMKQPADSKSPTPSKTSTTHKRATVSPPSTNSAMGIKWVPEDNLHLTLKFLGEVENVQIPEICNVAADVCSGFDPFELNFTGSGFLPDLARARVLIATVEDPTDSLTAMVSQLEDRYAALGFKREPRDYVPHLTLGRARGGSRRISQTAIDMWQRYENDPLGEMTARCVQVVGSFLEKRGPTYNVMHTVEL
ncbi:RNA 2',3'-cyclic phosphodiesterase [Aporhodopirellula aestuarii]|uniref:RNA 2',3'-cyclic phosphodiesterase n=1 Tax=Aporhodopirellula aestuarii TaxID=2950107 RepID=A0ABT0UBQ5_9BACT|nr:RNA 2',3'-cyclic phosphodiesterase [Aporhodopirellula aestuarii]MCM2373766.1 RNA 2',3'-cyclic phosphodiesterase [Aporhodopirellula aestuarii]